MTNSSPDRGPGSVTTPAWARPRTVKPSAPTAPPEPSVAEVPVPGDFSAGFRAPAPTGTGTPTPAPMPVPSSDLVPRFDERVLRGDRAGLATGIRFDTDLRRPTTVAPAPVCDTAAQAAGYAAGWAEGRRAAAVAARAEADQAVAAARAAAAAQAERVTASLGAIAAACGRLERQVAPGLHELEQTVVAAAFALAEAVIGRELETATRPGADAVARALAVAPTGGPVTVRLHPADLASMTEVGGVAGHTTVDGRDVLLVADPGLQRGDAVAECDATRVEARLAAAVERMREVLFDAAG